MLVALSCVIHRDLLLAVRTPVPIVLTVLLFFVIVVRPLPSWNRTGSGAPPHDRARRHLGGGDCSPRCSRCSGCSPPTRRWNAPEQCCSPHPLGMIVGAKVLAIGSSQACRSS